MSLLTRCPRCRTLFRVTPAQLQARRGTVRCGRCMHVFDGYQALGAEPQPAIAAPVRPADAAEDASAQAPMAMTVTAAENASSPNPGPAGATATATVSADGVRLSNDAPLAPPHALPASTAQTPAAGGGAYMQHLLRSATPAQRWSIATVTLALLLFVQAAFVFRSELAARFAFARSAWTAICEHAGCTVALPQRPQLVRIEASDVHMVDASRPQLVQLTATLRSYASYDLAYPALDLVLTNANEHALARRIFTPDEYLDSTRDPQAGIAANAEITVALDLDTGSLNAAGFRLDLLPAP